MYNNQYQGQYPGNFPAHSSRQKIIYVKKEDKSQEHFDHKPEIYKRKANQTNVNQLQSILSTI